MALTITTPGAASVGPAIAGGTPSKFTINTPEIIKIKPTIV